MKAKEISDLYLFCASVQHGGFAAASDHAKVSAPTLSRAVSNLEDKVGEKLIHRNAKQFQLTAAGDEYFQKFSTIFEQLNDQWLQLSNSQPTLTGDIRVSCPEPFADGVLQETAIQFMKQHPGVNIHIEFSTDTDNFISNQIDLAIATKPPKAPQLIKRKLLNMTLSLAASPDYLNEHGRPKQVTDLINLNLLVGNSNPVWTFIEANKAVHIPVKAKYSINSLKLAIQAACAGVGICLMPNAAITSLVEKGSLEILLPEVECPAGIVYLVWAERKLMPARVSAFKETIINTLGQPNEHHN
jgi:DNA-binding transcriptional LysR family regulator